jgi:hypothetical protein
MQAFRKTLVDLVRICNGHSFFCLSEMGANETNTDNSEEDGSTPFLRSGRRNIGSCLGRHPATGNAVLSFMKGLFEATLRCRLGSFN